MDSSIQNSKIKSQNCNSKFKIGIRERTYKYALMVIKAIDKLPKEMTSATIGRQLLRSGTSVGANVAEARSASSKRDFINFLTYALKSANESKFWIDLIKDSGKLSPQEIKDLAQETNEICRILAASLLTLKKQTRL